VEAIKEAGTAATAIHKMAAALTVKETRKLRGKRELDSLTKAIVHLTIHSSLARQEKMTKNRFSATTPHKSYFSVTYSQLRIIPGAHVRERELKGT
jgi:hypothetical protein